MSNVIPDPYTGLLAGPTRVAVISGGDTLDRSAAWLAAFEALASVLVHHCTDLEEHAADDDDLDLVVVTGTGAWTTATVWAALRQGRHVAYDQPVASRLGEVRALFAFAEEEGLHLSQVSPYGHLGAAMGPLIARARLGALRWAAVLLRLADPAVGAASAAGTRPELALDALGLALPLLPRSHPTWLSSGGPDPASAMRDAELRFGSGPSLAVSVGPGEGNAYDEYELELELAGGVLTLRWAPDSGSAPTVERRIGGRLAPPAPQRRVFASECFEETALTVIRAVRGPRPFDAEAQATALERVAIACGLQALATAPGGLPIVRD
jgi:hypothetical protein